jgi:hypothetical protein
LKLIYLNTWVGEELARVTPRVNATWDVEHRSGESGRGKNVTRDHDEGKMAD